MLHDRIRFHDWSGIFIVSADISSNVGSAGLADTVWLLTGFH